MYFTVEVFPSPETSMVPFDTTFPAFFDVNARKLVHVARPSPTFRRQPGADKNAIVAELDENAIARHLLNSLDFGPRPPK